jgi:hypothetical protein
MPAFNSSDLRWKGRTGERELLGLPVESVDVLGAGVAQQKR